MRLHTDMMEQNLNASIRVAKERTGTSRFAGPRHTVVEPNAFASRRLRILHVFTYLGLGGTELTALRIIANLDPKRFENLICGVRGFDSRVVLRRCPGIDVIVPSSRGKKSPTSVSSLLDVIKNYKPDIVHSRNWGTIESIPAAWFAKVPGVIHSEHGYEMETLTSIPARRRIFRRAVYGLADVVFTVTGELREFHARQAWVSSRRIRVIPNGVDTEVFAPRPHLTRSVREKLRLPLERFVIGSLGRMVPIKNHVAILKAAETLLYRGIDVHVLLVGSGSELDRYQNYVTSSDTLRDRVTFLGATENVTEALNAMDVFVLPSFSEGMSNTLLEAMSCGMPVVATRVGGNPEVIEENCSGLLFAPGDVEQLSDCVVRLAQQQDFRGQLGEAARQRILAKFSLERMLDSYSQLYLEFAAKADLQPRGSR